MRHRRTRFGPLVALAAVAALALSTGGWAQAAGDAIVPITGTTLQGGGPSTWDVASASTGCALTGFTPISDGSWRTRTDAFDNGLVLAIDGTAFDDADGDAIMSVPDQLVTTDNTTFSPVNVTRTDRALHSSATLRTLVKFSNTGGTTANLTVEWDSDLGSDTDTQVRASSNGNNTYNLSDRWAISSDSPSAPGDPVLTFVMFGQHAATHPDNIVTALGNGQTCFTVDTSLAVPAGGTRYLMFFTEMNGSRKTAVKGTGKFDTLSPGDALVTGLKTAVLNRIANWNL
jgi:hypothetical protein